MDFEQLAERNPAVRALLDSLPPRLLAASRLITAGTGQVFLLRGAPVEYGYLLLEGRCTSLTRRQTARPPTG